MRAEFLSDISETRLARVWRRSGRATTNALVKIERPVQSSPTPGSAANGRKATAP